MAAIALDESNFRATVSRSGVVLVDCWAAWCGACKSFEPIYERVAGRYPDHTFAKLDTQSEKGLRATLELAHIPTLLVYRDGLLLLKHPGSPDENMLESIISQAAALDMGRVREEMVAEEAPPS